MRQRRAIIIDMTPEGEFRAPNPAAFGRTPWLFRLAAIGAVIAVIAGAFALAAFAFWLAVTLLPVVIIAAAIAYAALRVQLWRSGRGFRG